jgi:nucleoside-diphosphate kinase
MVKPEVVAVGKQEEIIDILTKNGFVIRKSKEFTFSEERARRFYGLHEGKRFFEDLIIYITSGPVIGLELEKDNAIKDLRTLVGATDPAESEPGTVRHAYGTDLRHNAVHASDSPESAEKELAIVFAED